MDYIAVSWSEFKESGCVNCGCGYCFTGSVSGGGCSPVTCGECDQKFMILADGLQKSPMGFGTGNKLPDGKDEFFYPELQAHPRKGTPKHEYVKPDLIPEGGGEYWRSRGVGYDLSGFVESKEAGARIVEMVKKVIGRDSKTWLDYRPSEPKWIQVKFQSEDGLDLEKLHALCREDGIITEERIIEALKIPRSPAMATNLDVVYGAARQCGKVEWTTAALKSLERDPACPPERPSEDILHEVTCSECGLINPDELKDGLCAECYEVEAQMAIANEEDLILWGTMEDLERGEFKSNG